MIIILVMPAYINCSLNTDTSILKYNAFAVNLQTTTRQIGERYQVVSFILLVAPITTVTTLFKGLLFNPSINRKPLQTDF